MVEKKCLRCGMDCGDEHKIIRGPDMGKYICESCQDIEIWNALHGDYNADQPDYYPPPELRFSSKELSEDPWDQ